MWCGTFCSVLTAATSRSYYGIGMLQVMLNDKCFSVDILVDWLNGIEGGLWSIQEANDILNGINGPIGAIE